MADTLAEVREGLERCEQSHVGQEYSFCENYGCMVVRPLYDLAVSLTAELDAANHEHQAHHGFCSATPAVCSHEAQLETALTQRDLALGVVRDMEAVIQAARADLEHDCVASPTCSEFANRSGEYVCGERDRLVQAVVAAFAKLDTSPTEGGAPCLNQKLSSCK